MIMISKICFLSFFLPSVVAQFTTLSDDPLCANIGSIPIRGTVVGVDVDTSPTSTVDTGDLSIANSLTPTTTLPFTESGFKIFQLDTKSICVETGAVANDSAPTCFIETQLDICGTGLNRRELQKPTAGSVISGPTIGGCTTRHYKGNITAHGSGPDPFAITGGTGDFFAASGLIDGAGSFSFTPPNIVDFNFAFNVCFFPDAL